MNATHQAILRLRGGRYPRTLVGMPAVELHTVGRRTGERRTTMLTLPLHHDGRVVLVAFKAAMIETRSGTATRERTQRWRSAIAGETKKMQARTASAEEKTAMWPDIVTTYKG
jgi:F420H(2)-dependent quinone reductase